MTKEETSIGRESLAILEEISRKLDKLIALVACQGRSLDDKVRILTSQGLSSEEIGDIIGLTKEAVRKRRSRLRQHA